MKRARAVSSSGRMHKVAESYVSGLKEPDMAKTRFGRPAKAFMLVKSFIEPHEFRSKSYKGRSNRPRQ